MTVRLSQIIDEVNLERAWVRAKYWAQTCDLYYDATEYDQFERHLSANLKVVKWLLIGGYEPGPALGIQVPKEDGFRVLYWLRCWDNVVAMAILNVLIPPVERVIRERSRGLSFGNRFQLGGTKQVLVDWRDQHAAFAAAARSFASLPSGHWYMRSDISEFYPSVGTDRVLGLLAPLVDEETYRLITALLRMEGRIANDEPATISGLPIGPAHSALLANLYLSEFDERILACTSYYARYVDDFFCAAPSQEEVQALFDRASRSLSEVGLLIHPEKTERYPVTDTACIDRTIRRLKYDLRMETRELEESGLREQAESLLYEAFVDSEYYENPKAAAFLAWRLRDLGYTDLDALTDMVCRVIESGGLTADQIRRLLVFVIENSPSGFPNRLVQYLISNDEASVRLVALDLLSDYPDCAELLPPDMLATLAQSRSFLVRAYGYQTLGGSSNQVVAIDQLWALYGVEVSALVRAKMIMVMLVRYHDQVVSELPLRMTESHEVRQAILASIGELDEHIARAVVAAAPRDHDRNTEFSLYVYAMLRHGMGERLRTYLEAQVTLPAGRDREEAVAAVAIGLFDEQLKVGDHFGCLDVLSIVASLDPDLAAQSVHRLGGELEAPSASVAARFATRIGEVVPDIASKTPLWTLEPGELPRVLFLGQYRIRQDLIALEPGSVGLYQVERLDTGQSGLLELVPWPRLEANGISGTGFHAILDRSSEEGVSTPLVKGDIDFAFGVRYTWAVYLYPQGSMLLGDYIQRSWQCARIYEKTAVLLDLARQVRDSGLAERMQSVHGQSVVIDDRLHTRLCAIGTSIIDTRYRFVFSSECRADALGTANLSFCFGMLLYEFITGQSGYEDLQLTRREQGSLRDKVAQALPASKGLPHAAYVIDRATARLLDHRYTQVRSLTEDLAHIVRYLDRLEEAGLSEPADASWSLVVADYLNFRLNVMLRSPRAIALTTPKERRRYLFDELVQEWIDIMSQESSEIGSHDLGVPYSIRMSSPAAEQLVKLAECVWYLVSRANSTFGAHYPARVPLLILARLLDFEAAATTYSLVSDLAATPADLAGVSSRLLSLGTHGGDGDVWVGPSADGSDRVVVHIDPQRGQRLAAIAGNLDSPRQAAMQVADMVDVALVAALRTGGLHFGGDSTLLSFDDLWLMPPVSTDAVQTLLLISSALEAELQDAFSGGGNGELQSTLSEHLIPVIRILHRLRRARRIRGLITGYDRLRHQQGKFEWRPHLVRRASCIWRSQDVLRIGLEPWRTDRQMHASLDFSAKGPTILAVMTPISRSPLLRLDSLWGRARRKCREHWIICILGVVVVLLSALLMANRMMGQAALALVTDILILVLGLWLEELRDVLSAHLRKK